MGLMTESKIVSESIVVGAINTLVGGIEGKNLCPGEGETFGVRIIHDS